MLFFLFTNLFGKIDSKAVSIILMQLFNVKTVKKFIKMNKKLIFSIFAKKISV